MQDATVLTKKTYQDLVDKIYRRYEDVAHELQQTVTDTGHDSEEHYSDYSDLNYPGFWIREQVAKHLFSGHDADPLTMAAEALAHSSHKPTEATLMQWVRRHLEEEGVPAALYKEHLKDNLVPANRHTGKNPLWDQFMAEAQKLLSSRLHELVDEVEAN